MKFDADCHFNIGAEHISGGKPCQDYAISGHHEGIAYAIVSDGCSSGGHTDVGARLITLSTAAAIREHFDVEGEGNALHANAAQDVEIRRQLLLGGIKETLRLDPSDMLATELYVYLTPKGGYVHVAGDGVVAFVYVGGRTRLHRFDWPNNMPFYPAYIDQLPGFIRAHGGDLKAKVLTEQVYECAPPSEGGWSTMSTVLHSMSDGIRGINLPVTADELSTLAFVVVFSDGVTRVDNVDWKDAALDLLDFRTATGVFAKRRMIFFLREVRKKGKGPLDDIAFGVVSIHHKEDEVPDGH